MTSSCDAVFFLVFPNINYFFAWWCRRCPMMLVFGFWFLVLTHFSFFVFFYKIVSDRWWVKCRISVTITQLSCIRPTCRFIYTDGCIILYLVRGINLKNKVLCFVGAPYISPVTLQTSLLAGINWLSNPAEVSGWVRHITKYIGPPFPPFRRCPRWNLDASRLTECKYQEENLKKKTTKRNFTSTNYVITL